jgi:transcriptional regulator with PAS, ATPase and Fis domain
MFWRPRSHYYHGLLAEGGTLFLDELGDLLLSLQAKLLRVLQERVIERIGSTRPVPLNVRLIAATNRNLRQMIAEGQFREDLYYRLNVVKIRMPPLRERMDDLPALAMFFVDKCATRAGRRLRGLSTEAIEVLRAYHWPGNIRELENTIVSAVALGEDEWIQPHDLPEEVREKTCRLPDSEVDSKAKSLPNYRLCVREARQQLILSAFEESGYDHQEAAQRLKMHPNNLHRVVKSLGLKDMLRQRRAVCICGSQRFEVGP